MRISFEIEPFNVHMKTLLVKCTIQNISNKEFIQLYLGKVKWENVKCNSTIEEKGSFALVNSNNFNSISFSYIVKIGHLSKHGHGGDVSHNLITFAGEQVLVFPVEVLTMNDSANIRFISNITISFDFNNYKYGIMPFKNNHNKLSIDFPKWINIYDIMKSSYTFGNFNFNKYIENENILEIYSENVFDSKEICIDVMEDLKRLYDYYCKVFNSCEMKLSLILLNKNSCDGNYILGGCGVSTIAATFNYKNLRDWQLLCHRMFHAFMDYKLKLREAHIPPNLWLTEGLATYYEIMALDAISHSRKMELVINGEYEFKKLFARYLYMKLRDENISTIVPMDERNIKSHGSIEFLHYTLAPLIVKLIESKYNSLNKNNFIIEEMILLKDSSEDFSMESIFHNILKENINEFASKYLFGNEVLPLWFLGKYDFHKDKIIEDLNYYEYILWTWFKLEDENYMRYESKGNNFEKISDLTHKLGVDFGNKQLENKVQEFSYTLYILLKEYALRAKVCSISYTDKNLRNYLLGNEENIYLWEKFIHNNLENN